jgi:apoptosis-inducing factor 3
MEWIKVAERREVPEGRMLQVRVGEKPIVVTLYEGKLYAFNAGCPHASANLVEGDLRPAMVICPLHAYRFDLRTGICLKPRDGPRLRVYPAEWRGDAVWVRM